MIRLFSLFTCCIFPVALWSETIAVRSGEHADFSRLVMQFSSQANWNVGRFEGGYIFETAARPVNFDLSRVFDLIPKNRITKIESIPDGILKIYTSPNSHADVFELRAGRVVIDIKNGLAPNGSKFESYFEESYSNDIIKHEKNTGSLIQAGQGTTFSSFTDELLTENIDVLFEQPKLGSTEHSTSEASSFFSPEIDPLNINTADITELEVRLINQISNAASQGLLEISLPTTEIAFNPLIPTEVEPVKVAQKSNSTVILVPEKMAHVRIQDTNTQTSTFFPQTPQFNPDGTPCLDDSMLNIATWGPPLNEGLDFSSFRSETIGEFDLPNKLGVENLAKYYLYLTFGAEAETTLKEFGIFAPQANILHAISDIMDIGYSRNPSILKNQLECNGIVAFWAALAQEELPKGLQYPVKYIGNYFSGLPIHLRRHLGPILSERYIKLGNIPAAKMIQNAITRVESQPSDALKLLDAEMLLSQNDVTSAIFQIEEVVYEDGPLAPKALIKAIEIRAQKNLNIDPRLAEFSAILALEHHGTELAQPLEYASILAQIHSGSEHIALKSILEDKPIDLSDIELNELLAAASHKIVMSPDDIKFAHSAASILQKDKVDVLSSEILHSISERLLDIGFHDLAYGYLEKGEKSDDWFRLAKAKIEISKGSHNKALEYLNDNQHVEAAGLRANILLRLGQASQAESEFTEAGELEKSLDAAFLSENWLALENSPNTPLSSIADLFLNDAQSSTVSGEPTSIADLDNLLARSQTTRKTFETFINQ